MNQTEIKAAIAEQEEYIRRISGCSGTSCRAHEYRPFRYIGSELPVPQEHLWSACVNCQVTETRDDYAKKLTWTSS